MFSSRVPGPIGPVPFTRLKPAQVRLQPQGHALEHQPGGRAVRLLHRGPLRVAQQPEQLAALSVDDRQRVGQPRRRRRDQLEMEFRQGGPGPGHLGKPAGDPLLSGRGQRVDLAVRPVRQPGRLLGR